MDGGGDLGVVLASPSHPNRLQLNDGNGPLSDETAERLPAHTFSSQAGTVVDFNNDGAPDLPVGAIQAPGFVPQQLRAWQNDGKG